MSKKSEHYKNKTVTKKSTNLKTTNYVKKIRRTGRK
jgi:hypothetical protein